jgi:hypothetical protein
LPNATFAPELKGKTQFCDIEPHITFGEVRLKTSQWLYKSKIVNKGRGLARYRWIAIPAGLERLLQSLAIRARDFKKALHARRIEVQLPRTEHNKVGL